MANADRNNRPTRAKNIASTARKTQAGVRLDLRLYLYPDGHANIGIPAGEPTKNGIPVHSDLDLMTHLAMVLRYVDRTGSEEVAV